MSSKSKDEHNSNLNYQNDNPNEHKLNKMTKSNLIRAKSNTKYQKVIKNPNERI